MKKVSYAIAMRIRLAIAFILFPIILAYYLTPFSWPLHAFFAAAFVACLCVAIGMNLISDDAPNEYRGVKEYFIKNVPFHHAILLTILQYILLSIGIWKIINLLY